MTKNKLIILLISILCVIMFAYLQINVISNQDAFSPKPSDAILVLGHSINPKDGTPDEWMALRLLSALELYNEGYAKKIIVSGGKAPDDVMSAAEAMKQWFVYNGVDSANILIENKSATTDENFKFSKVIADENGIGSIIVVTNDFHIYRSMIIASDYFSDISGYASDVDFSFNKLLAYLKEPFSIIKYYIIRCF